MPHFGMLRCGSRRPFATSSSTGIQLPSLSVPLTFRSSPFSLEDSILSVVQAQAQATAAEQSTGEEEAVPKVESPVVVVTGASRGIGKAIALSLGKAGCKVKTLHTISCNFGFFCSGGVFLLLYIFNVFILVIDLVPKSFTLHHTSLRKS